MLYKIVELSSSVFKVLNLKTRIMGIESYSTRIAAELAIKRRMDLYSDYELGCLAFQLGEPAAGNEEFLRGYNEEAELKWQIDGRNNLLDIQSNKQLTRLKREINSRVSLTPEEAFLQSIEE